MGIVGRIGPLIRNVAVALGMFGRAGITSSTFTVTEEGAPVMERGTGGKALLKPKP